MIDLGKSTLNSALYSWRICVLCLVLVTMTSLSTSSKGRDRPKSVMASADATLTLSEGAGVVNVQRWVDGQAAALGVGGCVLRNRSLCTLSVIFCSNEQIYAGFGGKVRQLVPKQCINGRKKDGVQSDGNRCKDTVVF